MYEHRQSFTNHFGVDLKSSDLNRLPQYASGAMNAKYTSEGSPEKRRGYQARGIPVGGYGQWTYERKNPTTGADEKELLKIDDNLHRMDEAILSVAYAGAETSCIVSLFLDPYDRTYKCTIVAGTTTVLDTDLGVGIDESSPVTLADLAALINAIPNFTASVTGTSSTPAAFCKIVRAHDIVVDGTLELEAKYFTQINSTVSNPLATYLTHRNDDNAENVSAVQVQNCMYFGSGYDEVMKYDGQTFYRAGLPTPATTFAAALVGAGSVTGSNYQHRMRYVQYDAAGNLIEGNLQSSVVQNAAAENFSLTVPNIQAGTGFNTNCALVNGAQVGVTTITVTNSPHTMKAGDTAYFLDRSSGTYVTRTVTAVTATTVVISGAAVNVNNGDVISNNLRIGIYRSKSSGSTPLAWYEVVEIPNNSLAATTTYVDSKVDSALGAQLVTPATDRSTPPKGKYVSQWNGIMMVAGVPTDPLLLAWSDVDGCEYFPSDTNAVYIESGAQDVISGIAPNNEVFTIHGERSFTVMSGDILTGQLRFETKARDQGCVAHATIQELDGVLYWLSANGPRCSSGGQVPKPVGPATDQESASRIDPEFDNRGRTSDQQFKLKRAVGFTDLQENLYQLFVPAEQAAGGDIYPNDNSRVYAYDKTRDAWLPWNNLNFAGGISQFDDEVYFSERRYSSFNSNVDSVFYSRLNLNDAYDYADNVEEIGGALQGWQYDTSWYGFERPSVLKKILRLKIMALESIANNEFTVSVIQEINFQRDIAMATWDMALISAGGYGESEYGTTPYGDPAEANDTHPCYRGRVKTARFRFQNRNIHENVILTGWELECALPYKPKFSP